MHNDSHSNRVYNYKNSRDTREAYVEFRYIIGTDVMVNDGFECQIRST